jgi:nicotinate-nucleotide--dimethylbenzimidazole phosphoribosyltransferase
MSEQGVRRAIQAGLDAVPEGIDLLALGEMGIANTTAAAAVAAGLYREPAAAWAGPGTGLDPTGVRHKADVIQQGLARHEAALGDPLGVLQHLGGRDLAALTGAILGARLRRVPVLLDGFTATVPAAILQALAPGSIEHCRAGHRSAEPGHRKLLDRLGLIPLLELGMRLGEGSGAAVAIHLVRAAVACHVGMATFGEAAVSRKP